MSGNVSTEEAAALAAAAGATDGDARGRAAVVAPRDFTEPRTLSAERIARIRKTLSARMHSIANVLAGPLRGHPTLTLGEVGEVNAQGLFDGFVRPFLVHGFQCAGQQGWVLWDAAAARIASDTILSGPKEEEPEIADEEVDDEDESEAEADEEKAEEPEPEEPEIGDPMLTRTERRVVSSLLDEILRAIAEQFGRDLGLQVREGEHEVGGEREDLGDIGRGEGRDARLFLAHTRRADGIARHADDAVLFAQQVECFYRFLGQTDNALWRKPAHGLQNIPARFGSAAPGGSRHVQLQSFERGCC